MDNDKYKCHSCGGTFEKGWTDEEAMAESKETWGDVPEDELVALCDTCYQRMMNWINNTAGSA